ncbi:hypothetical protein [Magnetospirillum sp. XM-1]|uniref:hypothetical protein n=1 Tax=Magnetospirillum sp. XM-1 TaxID=1663591 RepID=UPI0012E37C4F|nr:hypothetical protein [Magnetospirillum sp. XM-1]
MRSIDAAFTKFDDPYYSNIRTAYQDYATPQLEDQYSKAKQQLAYALARGGISDSTIAGERQAALQKEYDINRGALVDEALNQEKQARSAVSNERSSLVSQLNASADPAAASAASAAAANNLSLRPTFSPIGQMFTNIAASLAASQPTATDGTGILGQIAKSNLFGSKTATGTGNATAAGSSRIVN